MVILNKDRVTYYKKVKYSVFSVFEILNLASIVSENLKQRGGSAYSSTPYF